MHIGGVAIADEDKGTGAGFQHVGEILGTQQRRQITVDPRLASYFLGNRTYAFTTLLACVLVSLAVGSWLSARLYERFETRLRDLFGWTLAVALIASLLSTAGVALL